MSRGKYLESKKRAAKDNALPDTVSGWLVITQTNKHLRDALEERKSKKPVLLQG